MCPMPSNLRASTTSVPAPTTSHAIPSHPPSQQQSPPLLDAPPSKRLRQYGNCGRAVHNHYSCRQVHEN